MQVNARRSTRRWSRARSRCCELEAQSRVLDLFCGFGNFTLPLARRAARWWAWRRQAALVERARHNALLNGLAMRNSTLRT